MHGLRARHAPQAPGRCAVTCITPRSREQELRNALGKARLPLAARWVVLRLLDRADHGTATIPARFQFRRGLDELADWCVMPKSTLRGALRTAEFHGWVTRWRWSIVPGYEPQRVAGGDAAGGRGHPTFYDVERGTDCPGRSCPCGKKRDGSRSLPPTETGQNPPPLRAETGRNTARKQGGAFRRPAGHDAVSLEGRGEGEVREGHAQTEPVCQVCGAPVSPLRRAQTLARGVGVVCGRCEALPPSEGRAGQRERRRP